ncbi:hypothetical protein M3D15_01005 [Pseudoclavibacter alba]|uniref:Uncharacterized protein n=1 Tax=Pseudoclavibacter albus TaxID=272241 RepID=A0ABT2HUX0_9MICO|nr:hypothetical protein [Pseudoclavibacter alba]MCT2041925.1 hypothetical protein [Pseudoclavibacter alba]
MTRYPGYRIEEREAVHNHVRTKPMTDPDGVQGLFRFYCILQRRPHDKTLVLWHFRGSTPKERAVALATAEKYLETGRVWPVRHWNYERQQWYRRKYRTGEHAGRWVYCLKPLGYLIDIDREFMQLMEATGLGSLDLGTNGMETNATVERAEP